MQVFTLIQSVFIKFYRFKFLFNRYYLEKKIAICNEATATTNRTKNKETKIKHIDLFYWAIYDLGFEFDLDASDFTHKTSKVIKVLMQLKSQVI